MLHERASDQALLEVSQLKKNFPLSSGWFASRKRRFVNAVDEISLTLAKGETLSLVGESGCGKSTVGRLILRLLEPTQGRISFDGTDLSTLSTQQLRSLRRRMQIIFQDPFASLNPRMTVSDTIAEPLALHRLASGDERTQRITELLSTVGLDPSYGSRYPHEFSGGQRQRIGIARALACQPDLIVCDEPVSALDVSTQAQVLALLMNLQQRFGLAYLFISHDMAVVRYVSHRVAVMYLGRLVEVADTHSLFTRPRHPYTRALLSAVPRANPLLKRARVILDGDVPSSINPPEGCRFHTRCQHATKRCQLEVPELIRLADRNLIACHHWEQIGREHVYENPGQRIDPRVEKRINMFRSLAS